LSGNPALPKESLSDPPEGVNPLDDKPPNAGQQLDAIMRDLDATTAAWATAGYGYGTPEDEAREAVFARLKAWNVEHGADVGPGRAHR
jgi:hypothetical protein